MVANALNHVASTLNPHNVTKTQVGLSNVPNTDFTTAVAANTANLDLKVDKIITKIKYRRLYHSGKD
jgi:hypothetical protein